MKHLKRFNEELAPEEVSSLEHSFMKAKLSPKTGKVPVKNLFVLLFIECTEEIEHPEGDPGKFLCVDLDNSSYVSVHESIEDIIDGLETFKIPCADRGDVGEIIFSIQNIGHENSSVVNLLDWNETNFQEIENILIDYDIYVENIWVVLK